MNPRIPDSAFSSGKQGAHNVCPCHCETPARCHGEATPRIVWFQALCGEGHRQAWEWEDRDRGRAWRVKEDREAVKKESPSRQEEQPAQSQSWAEGCCGQRLGSRGAGLLEDWTWVVGAGDTALRDTALGATGPRLVPCLMETLAEVSKREVTGSPVMWPLQTGRCARGSFGGIQSAHVILGEQSLGMLREGHHRGLFREM